MTELSHTDEQVRQAPSSSSASEYWRSRRQHIQAERLRQLQDLEHRVADATDMSRRRAEIVLRPNECIKDDSIGDELRSRLEQKLKNEPHKDDGVTDKTLASDSPCEDVLNLQDASIEDLTGLMAASALRIANFHSSNSSTPTKSRESTVHSDGHTGQTTPDAYKDAKILSLSHSPSSQEDCRELLDIHHQYTKQTPPSLKSRNRSATPSARRPMQRSHKVDEPPCATPSHGHSKRTLPGVANHTRTVPKSSSTSPIATKLPTTKPSTPPTASLRTNLPTPTASRSQRLRAPSSTRKTEQENMALEATRSTVATATTRIDVPRQSTSSVPRSSPRPNHASPLTMRSRLQKTTSSTTLRSRDNENVGQTTPVVAPRKMKTLPLQIGKHTKREPLLPLDTNRDIDVRRGIKCVPLPVARKEPSTANSDAKAKAPSNKVAPSARPGGLPKPIVTKPSVLGRKRGKTLPGNLASPPAIAPLVLPPMKMERLDMTIPNTASRTTARTPTRIPSRVLAQGNLDGTDVASIENEIPRQSTSKTPVKVGPTTTVYSGTTAITSPSRNGISSKSSQRPTGSSVKMAYMSRSTHTSSTRHAPPVGGESTQARTRKHSGPAANRTMPMSSVSAKTTRSNAHGFMSGADSFEGFRNRRKVTTPLHDSVDESGARRLQTEREQKEIVIRGGGGRSTKTSPRAGNGYNPIIRVALTPLAALKLYEGSLSLYEHTEVMDYVYVYFVGHHAKKVQARVDQPQGNYGYDDDRGDYQVVLKDHLHYRYEILGVLGRGSFGQVLKCFDHKCRQTVAIKLIRNKKRFHAQALVEIRILENLVDWDPEDDHHNVRIRDHFTFRGHLCLVFECLDINLYDFLKNNRFQGCDMAWVHRVAVQLLKSLSLTYRHKLIHCDLKPENILLKHPASGTIKVIDFGSSCFENEKVYTYIQSRFYRAPEVILGMNYSMAIDMWSLGCILAELLTGYPLFPGGDGQEQLACIMEIQGKPDRYLVEKSTRRNLFFDAAGNPRITATAGKKKRYPGTVTLQAALKTNQADFVDFVRQCLHWDPERRLTPDAASRHPWIAATQSPS